jgi:hypothetical protein
MAVIPAKAGIQLRPRTGYRPSRLCEKSWGLSKKVEM